MTRNRFGVGIVGLTPERSWAAIAHVPALHALSDDFDLVGVANTSRESAERAVAALGLKRAFASVDELLAAPEVNIVAVTVKVPHHHALVSAALAAGKHVYCEWPLGNGLTEAEQLAALARQKGVLGVVGTQARVAAEIIHLRKLIADGLIGTVLSTTLIGWGTTWNVTVPVEKPNLYLYDRANGATMLTIPLGHTLAAVRDVLGEVASVSSVVTTRRREAVARDTGQPLPVTAPDQVLVSGLLASGAPLAIHYRGGPPPSGEGLLWEITGTEGDIRLTGLAQGGAQRNPLTLKVARGNNREFTPVEVPASLRTGYPADLTPGNVARLYARMAADLREGTRTAPTFDDAVALHRILAAIEKASSERRHVSVQ